MATSRARQRRSWCLAMVIGTWEWTLVAERVRRTTGCQFFLRTAADRRNRRNDAPAAMLGRRCDPCRVR